MRLNLARLRNTSISGVTGVTGVTASIHAAKSCNTENMAGVTGVTEGGTGEGESNLVTPVTPVTPAKNQVSQETANVYGGVTPVTPVTPEKQRTPSTCHPQNRSSVLTVPTQSNDIGDSKRLPVQDPACWEEDFARWALARCLFRDGCLWRVEALHDNFCDWCNLQGEVPCMLPTFAALVESEGFTVMAGMVQGLVLKEEYLSLTVPERKAKAAPIWNGNRP